MEDKIKLTGITFYDEQGKLSGMHHITNAGTEVYMPDNFAMMIPKDIAKPTKAPFFKMWREFGYWHIKIKKPHYPKILNKILRPLCKYGLHRWKATYAFNSFNISKYNSPNAEISNIKKEQAYQCARCKKTKAVPITT